jgi:hypothetical protein
LLSSFFVNTIKSIRRHLSFINFITGVISLLIIILIKEVGLPLFILNLLKDYIPNIPYVSEYFIASFLGLICRLGLKGLIEDGLKDIFPAYNAMTGAGDINPADSSNSGGRQDNTSGGSSNNPTDIEKDSDKTPEKNTTTISKEKGNYVSKRYVELFDLQAQRISAEIKALTVEISNCKDEEEKAYKMEELDELFGQLTMLSKESAVETRKILSSDSSSSNKRSSDLSVAQDSSKKRS